MLASFALAAVLSAATPVPAPISSVTVFGDRARVVRAASLPAGTVELAFPILPDSAVRESVRLQVDGATLERVQIGDVPPEAFPVGAGQKLIAQLQALDDQLAALDAEAGAVREALDSVRTASPSTDLPPPDSAGRRAPLDPSGWGGAMAFARTTSASLRARLVKLELRARDLRDQRAHVADQALLLGAVKRPSGFQVTAWVHGGPGRATLTYDVVNAAWRPLYDVQLDPVKSEVHLALAGLVTQQTGEDWTDARLTLSTAIPATASRYPELPVWKIGERERFVPTPRPHPLPLSPPPPAPPLPAVFDRAPIIRQRLLALASAAPVTIETRSERANGVGGAPMPEPAPMAAAAPPPPPMAPDEDRPAPSEQAAPKAAMDFDEVTVESGVVRREAEPAQSLPLGPPVRYRPPYVPPDYPAALASGYDLEYQSVRPETVRSGDGQRRVALTSRHFPVRLTRELFPALAQAAFLVADLANASSQPIAGGRAELFVGDDPAGNAQLPFVAPGERFTLPLGVDRAVQPVRRVDLVQGEAGFFEKDDVRTYRVTLELANPYPKPIDLHVVDQWPITHDEHVHVTLDETAPAAEQDPRTGQLDWRITVPPSSKQVLHFSFTVRCPKGWLLTQ
ncbi:MAG TPA: mucoidy inhibitor MuiA family protein [Myxococcales bacterium]|nr:mucoidy inhibitor MuiA family protein [Myxococcales bacterium]